MPNKVLSKVKINEEIYSLKDAQAREDIAKKQDAITEANKLSASLVSFTKDESSEIAATDVNAAILALEDAIGQGGIGSVVSVVKAETAEDGYFATYTITQGGKQVGASINIPKDYLVKSASIKTASKADDPYTGAKKGDKFIDFVINAKEGDGSESHLYLPVNELVDAYKADGTTLTLGEGNVFSLSTAITEKLTGFETSISDINTTINGLGALANKSTATGTVAAQTIAGVAVTGNVNLSLDSAVSSAETNAVLTKAAYTPAGTVSAKLSKDAEDAAAVAVSGVVSAPLINVTPTTSTVTPVTDVGTMASVDTSKFNAGAFPTLSAGTYIKPTLAAATTGKFATNGLVATVDETDTEMLVLSAATISDAVTAQGAFTAGDVTFGSLEGGTLPALEKGFFTEGKAPTLGTAVSYLTGVSATASAPTFTGDKFVIAATFAGSELKDALVTGVTYDKMAIDNSKVNATLDGLKTADIEVPAQEITVK